MTILQLAGVISISMAITSTTVIVRSVGERTEDLCRKLILAQGVPEEAVVIVREAPFSQAMRTSFRTGLEHGRPWTFCIDADVLLRAGSIQKMLDLADQQPRNVCEIQGFVLDKFFGGPRTAGNHIYRTSLLDRVLEAIPEEGVDVRPETHALQAMKAAGYPWRLVTELVGLHDFEQQYSDIFRKSFVQAHKHLSHIDLFVPFWREKAEEDIDYRVALSGFAAGVEYVGEIRIDRRAEYYRKGTQRLGLDDKCDLDPNSLGPNEIEQVIENWTEPHSYWVKYPGGMRGSANGMFSRSVAQYRWHRQRNSPIQSGVFVLGWHLERIGKRLRG